MTKEINCQKLKHQREHIHHIQDPSFLFSPKSEYSAYCFFTPLIREQKDGLEEWMQDSSQSYSSDLWKAEPKEFDSFHTALTWINTPSSFPQLDKDAILQSNKLIKSPDQNERNNFESLNRDFQKAKNFSIVLGDNFDEETAIEDSRKDIHMKSVLRRIHRDIKQDFYEHTSFDFNKLYRKEGYLKKCLDDYSLIVFGRAPSKIELVLLGSLISSKWAFSFIQQESDIGNIGTTDFATYNNLASQVYSALYKYSETMLQRLAGMDEFKRIVVKHAQICELNKMNKQELYFYNRVLDKFDIPPQSAIEEKKK